ncbi:LPS-assembly protein LptD [Thiobacillus sp.]
MSILPGITLAALLLAAHSAVADGLVLKKDVELKGSTAAGKEGPLFLTADKIESTAPDVVVASGKVEARQAGLNFFADWLRYDITQSQVQARGDVRLEQTTMVVTGDSLSFNIDDYSGELTQPVYRFTMQRGHENNSSNGDTAQGHTSAATPISGRGNASHIDFVNENQCTLQDAIYTTCPLGNDDWFLKVGSLDLDRSRNVGTARNVSLHFLGVPILYTPWMDFPLNNVRKSGILAPTFGTTERSGIDFLAPYYLNLAPNYDATLYPRLLSKRGVQLGGEFRYLLNDVHGVNRLEYLPNDNVAGRSRWSAALNNIYRLNDTTEAGMAFNRVSDDDYFRDLSNLLAVTSLTQLNREVWLSTQHANWNASIRAQSFQTLQDSTSSTPIPEPYALMPQAHLGLAKTFDNGLEFKMNSEATHFTHPTLVEGTRVLAYPTLRMPLTNSFGFLTPQIGWHSTYYALDNTTTRPQNISRSLPIFSLDSGVTFDRPFHFAGKDYEQTLEPRAYYVFAPYRNQDDIPNFDTGLLDFSYAQMFTENQFIGGDRVNDANQLTVAVTSRFTEATSGLERLQVTLGQRFYFSEQRVTLNPGDPVRTTNATDLLAAISGQVTRNWRIDTAWQFDTQNGTTIRQNLGASYRPTPGRVVNLGYRFIDQTTEQVDLSAQWPLARRWYGLFRYNYSFKDDKLVEGLAGFEYNGGCWALRGVLQRLATKENQSTDALFFQLELNGMGRIGSNPLDVLKHSVPGYRPSNELIQTP